jgi:dimeric dUTPase (all-alpha-NTP-PPase superfamily)
MKDKLDDIFDKQICLQRRIHYGDKILPSVQLDKIPMTVTSIVAELGEILHAQHGWKNYNMSSKPIDKANLDEEIADLWHFIANLTMQLGYSAEDTYKCFLAKNKINHERQDLK